jgi:hypothetical protein
MKRNKVTEIGLPKTKFHKALFGLPLNYICDQCPRKIICLLQIDSAWEPDKACQKLEEPNIHFFECPYFKLTVMKTDFDLLYKKHSSLQYCSGNKKDFIKLVKEYLRLCWGGE